MHEYCTEYDALSTIVDSHHDNLPICFPNSYDCNPWDHDTMMKLAYYIMIMLLITRQIIATMSGILTDTIVH